MTRSEAARKAGKARAAQFTPASQAAAARALVEQRGVEHMREIGRKGARTFYKRYKWSPAAQSGWAIVDKRTGQVKRFVGSVPQFLTQCSCVTPDQSCPACRAAARRTYTGEQS